jgi:hypothetical protein
MMILSNPPQISAIDQVYGTLRFSNGQWQTYTGNQSLFGVSSGNMFVDSHGNLYASAHLAGPPYTSYIMESLVGSGPNYGLVWTEGAPFVHNDVTSMIWQFTEDEYGNLWAGEYANNAVLDGATLWRKQPGGSWTVVYTFTSTGRTGTRHVHYVYYDKWRRALYINIGDSEGAGNTAAGIRRLDVSKLNQYNFTATDFTYLMQTDTCGNVTDGTCTSGNFILPTAMVADSQYLYVGLDSHNLDSIWTPPNQGLNRAIARIVDKTSSGGTSAIQYVYPHANCGFATWADVDNYGNVIFRYNGDGATPGCTAGQYANKIIYSSDHGTTWNLAVDYGTSISGPLGGIPYTGLASAFGAPGWSGIYGGGNGWGAEDPPSGIATMGRLVPSSATYYMNESSGVDYVGLGLSSSSPIQSLRWLQSIPYSPHDLLYVLPSSGPYLKCPTNNPAMSTMTQFTPLITETFDSTSTSSWNFSFYTYPGTGNSVTQSNSIVHSGAGSMMMVLTGGQTSAKLKLGSYTPQFGDVIYLNFWVYCPSDETGHGELLWLFDNGASPFQTYLQRVAAGVSRLQNELILFTSSTGGDTIPSRNPLTTGVWHNVQWEQYLHPTSGYIQVHVDGKLWYIIPGIQTFTASTSTSGGSSAPYVTGINFNLYQNADTLYIDDFSFGFAKGPTAPPKFDWCVSTHSTQ